MTYEEAVQKRIKSNILLKQIKKARFIREFDLLRVKQEEGAQ